MEGKLVPLEDDDLVDATTLASTADIEKVIWYNFVTDTRLERYQEVKENMNTMVKKINPEDRRLKQS